MTVRYTHLHLHSEYSLVDSTIRIKALVEACVRARMPAVALTDECNMFALVKFYKAAMGAGVQPIIARMARWPARRATAAGGRLAGCQYQQRPDCLARPQE
jgi:DNA polymerase III alpha subunit